jgi:hypothetical protein
MYRNREQSRNLAKCLQANYVYRNREQSRSLKKKKKTSARKKTVNTYQNVRVECSQSTIPNEDAWRELRRGFIHSRQFFALFIFPKIKVMKPIFFLSLICLPPYAVGNMCQ